MLSASSLVASLPVTGGAGEDTFLMSMLQESRGESERALPPPMQSDTRPWRAFIVCKSGAESPAQDITTEDSPCKGRKTNWKQRQVAHREDAGV